MYSCYQYQVKNPTGVILNSAERIRCWFSPWGIFCHFKSSFLKKRNLNRKIGYLRKNAYLYVKKKAVQIFLILDSLKILNVYVFLNYTSLTFTAFNPFLPSCKSKVTSSFSLMFSLTPVECTKYSFNEAVSVMNPNEY